jgi:micrococcal nuclease
VRTSVLVLLLLLVGGCSTDGRSTAPPATSAQPGLRVPAGVQEAGVVRGVDGDTVVLRGRGTGPLPAEPTRVRLLLVDTPEVTGQPECFGEQASARAAELLPDGAQVRVLADRDQLDRYGRALLHVWTEDGTNVGEALVREGFATVLVVAPNRLYESTFRDAEAEAEAAGRGLWSACPAR